MEVEDTSHSHLPESKHAATLPHAGETRSLPLGLTWLLGMLTLAACFGLVGRYFDSTARLESLVEQNRVLPLREWTLRAYQCPSFYSDFNNCQQVTFDWESNDSGEAPKTLQIELPLSPKLKSQIHLLGERPTWLSFSHKLSEPEKEWLARRTTEQNAEWPSQAQLVALGSYECEAKQAGSEDFSPAEQPDKMICFTQSRFEPVRALPESGEIEYFIAPGKTADFGPTRWPLLLAENQHMHEILSLDQLTMSATVVWNLVSLLMPIFVIAFRFVFRNEKTLNTLADYALVLTGYALCITLLQQASLFPEPVQIFFSLLCIVLEGVILTLFVRYVFCMTSDTLWKLRPTIAVAILMCAGFVLAFAISGQKPQSFLLTSHHWRDSLGCGLACIALLAGLYLRAKRTELQGGASSSQLGLASDDFGSTSYLIRIACVVVPLLLFGFSNASELVNPSLKVLKWEDLMFLPSQTAVIAYHLGTRTSSTMRYGKSMKERLEMLFSAILSLQRTISPKEAVNSTVSALREVLPQAARAKVQFIEATKWEPSRMQTHASLIDNTLYIPLHSSLSYKGLLRLDGVSLTHLSEEEDYIISTLASALALNLENQISADDLDKMHRASLRFVPRDFLRLLKSESLKDFKLGDHVELSMTVLFADIRNFTYLSEGMTPSQNFEFINGFLMHIAPVIKHHGGFIDKYIGDAIMALFPNSAANASRCAIDMQIAVGKFNKRWHNILNQEVKIGIGLHYGAMVLGIVGYAERLSSTVISDAVNLAARLEGLTKKYMVDIIVSEGVLQHISPSERQELNPRMLDSVTVKGRNSMVTIYEIAVPEEKQRELDEVS
jgi:class 3 adenylate cyclase